MPITDFYTQCETGLAVRLRTLTTYFKKPEQVSNDDTVISTGAGNFAIYRPGAFPILGSLQTKKIMDMQWTVTVDLYVYYTNYKESWNKFKEVRAAIFFCVHEDQTLGNTPNVRYATLSSDENAQYFRFANSSESAKPNYIIQTMKVSIVQRVRFS
ncbi:MAG: hypothetical protein ABIO63_04125 [Casimicrobiaceae bacterium]